jgi:hypothetical protein
MKLLTLTKKLITNHSMGLDLKEELVAILTKICFVHHVRGEAEIAMKYVAKAIDIANTPRSIA